MSDVAIAIYVMSGIHLIECIISNVMATRRHDKHEERVIDVYKRAHEIYCSGQNEVKARLYDEIE